MVEKEVSSTIVEKNAESAKSEASEYYFDGKKVEIHELKMEITDVKVIQPGESGNEYGKKTCYYFLV